MSTKRSAPFNKSQKDILVEFIMQNNKLHTGKFDNEFTFKMAQKLWEEITVKLNSIPGGANKDWRQWRKTWQDIKKNTKAKVTKSKDHSKKTGGGSPMYQELDTTDIKVLDIMSPTSVEGLENVSETIIEYEDNQSNKMEEPESSIIVSPMDSNVTNIDFEKAGPSNATDVHITPTKRRKLTKTKRLENSLQISKQLVNGMEKKNSLMENYYKTKTTYLEHRKQYDVQKLQALQEKNEILRNIENHLSFLTDRRRDPSP